MNDKPIPYGVSPIKILSKEEFNKEFRHPMTDKPMTFLAMQDKFLKDLKYHISIAHDKAGYDHIGFPSLIKTLEDALEKAHELNVMEQGRIAYEKEFGNGR